MFQQMTKGFSKDRCYSMKISFILLNTYTFSTVKGLENL